MLNSKIADLNVSPTVSIDEARRASKRSDALAALRVLDDVAKTPDPAKSPEPVKEPEPAAVLPVADEASLQLAEPTTYPLKPSIFDDADELNLPEAPDLEALQAERESQDAPVDALAADAVDEPDETATKKRARSASTSARSRALLGKKKRSA